MAHFLRMALEYSGNLNGSSAACHFQDLLSSHRATRRRGRISRPLMSAARQPIGPMSQFVPNLHHCIWFCFTFEIDANSYRNASVKPLVCSLRLKNLKTERRKNSYIEYNAMSRRQ